MVSTEALKMYEECRKLELDYDPCQQLVVTLRKLLFQQLLTSLLIGNDSFNLRPQIAERRERSKYPECHCL